MPVAQITLLLFAAVAAFAGAVPAQVPEGWAVVATYHTRNYPGTPGLFLVPLVGTGAMVPVTGLPAALQYTGTASGPHGAASVSYRPSDGAIVVCTQAAAAGPTGGAVELYILHLQGNAVDPVRTQQFLLGTTTTAGGAWNALLPDGRILVAGGQGIGPFPSGPMAGSVLAIVDPSLPIPVTPLPNPAILGAGVAGGGVAVDPTGRFAYVPVTFQFNTPLMYATLQRFEIATGVFCLSPLATWPGQYIQGVCCDDDGTVLVSAVDMATQTHYVHTVRTSGCGQGVVVSRKSWLPLLPSGLDLDRASGRIAAASDVKRAGFVGPQMSALSLIDPATGNVTVIASPPAAGWGKIGGQGVAVHNAIESYGAASSGPVRCWFDNFPNLGGMPSVGNLGFYLTMGATPAPPSLGVLLLSSSSASIPILGVEILVDLNSAIVRCVPSGPSTPLPVPIPNNAGLRGMALAAQCLHLGAGGTLATSRGLMFTLR